MTASVLFDFCNINFHNCACKINFEYDNTFEGVKHLSWEDAFEKEEKTIIVKNWFIKRPEKKKNFGKKN